MSFTRSDRTIKDKIKTLLDLHIAITGKQNKIENAKKIFTILTKTSGITFVKKHSKFKKTVQDKLIEFSKEKKMNELAKKWHQQIFGEPIPEPEPEPEPEPQPEPEPDNTNPFLEQWIEEVSVSARLTRERRKYLTDLFETLEELTFTRSQKWIDNYSGELWHNLSTDYGQATINMFPELRTYLEKELYEEYERPNGEFWADYWPDIFGCEIDDDRYDCNC